MSYINRDFFTNIAMAGYSNIVPWAKIGYSPTINNTESDLWSAAGAYVFPPSAMQMEVIGGANDVGTTLHSGTSDGGSTTTVVNSAENFLTTTAVGDWVILDKSGTTPEWGIITAVTSDTTITCANGFSSGGTGSGRAYAILDKSASTGAQAVKIEYLNGSYVADSEIVILNGATAVATVQTDLFRIQSFRVICAGSGNAAGTALQLRETDDAPVYSYITAGYTRARNNMYTVPAGKTLYINHWATGWATPNDARSSPLDSTSERTSNRQPSSETTTSSTRSQRSSWRTEQSTRITRTP